jgi:hypothetical protein
MEPNQSPGGMEELPLSHSDEGVRQEHETELKKLEEPEDELFKPRACTDWYCSLIFLFFFLLLWCLSGWSFQIGYPSRLTRGWDMYGQVCGYNAPGLEYTYFPFPTQSMDVALCLSGCPVHDALESVCLYTDTRDPLSSYGCLDGYASKPFYNNYCLPAEYTKREAVTSYLYSMSRVLTRVVGDLDRVGST